MKRLHHLKIVHKLALGFSAVLALLLFVAALAYVRIAEINDGIDVVVKNRYPKIELLHGIKDALNDTTNDLASLVLLSEAESRQQAARRIQSASERISANLEQLNQNIRIPRGRALLDELTQRRQTFLAQRQAYLDLIGRGQREAALQLLVGELRGSQLRYFGVLDDLIVFQSGLMRDSGSAAEALSARTGQLLLLMCAMALATGVALAWVITASITGPLATAVTAATRVASGDLSQDLPAAGRDETGQLLSALQQMTDNLRTIVRQVRDGSTSLAGAAGEIASGNMDLSNRTEEQAGALEETASSMEQMTAAVRQNAEHARQAHALAEQASTAAREGGKVVGRAVQTMGTISDASRQIAEITGVINGIAFQTNILALNAAVEAARAGEQGRGFAVVASEVRNLAQRSAAAAKDIKQLIDHAGVQVEAGVALVRSAGSGMDDIVQRVASVGAVMGQILSASEEQSQGIEQINHAIAQMDQVTQQNAALVEEAAAAAAGMQEQSDALVGVVGAFRIDADTSADARPARRGVRARPALALAA